ncbi:MAG TPA: cbb3-type cytochrome c oxidase subunit I [Solirubrobacterales bacterium]|nr:cbb3-type cytochrome c oxidase subunit I [Solirubrobacterales bacterium]
MTPSTTATTPARPEVVTRGVPVARSAWSERVTSADHKVTGILFIGTALTFLALAATEFALMRLQLLVPENSMIEPEIFNRLLSAAPVTFVVLFAIPLALGLISYVVPLQIGARSTALPRLGQLSYWLYAMGALVLYASFLYAAPETGTLALPPLSDLTFSPTNGADAWIAGTALAVAGFVCFAINMLATLHRHRAPGLAFRRMPLFAWAATVINSILLVVGPLMLAALTMLLVDRRYDGVFFDPGEGGAPLLYEHLGYIFLTGCYLIVFLFAAGAISEILPTFARKPIFSHRAVAGSFVAIGGLGLLAWMQNMYEAPLNEGWPIAAMVFALALVVPVGLLIYNWIATVWGGALRMRAATWYAVAAISTMACGLAGELGYSVIPVGWALDNTTASQGDTLYVLVGGSVFGGFAALHYWFPKISARLLGEGLGKIALLVMLVGIHLYVLPMFLAGLEGQPVDIFKYYEDTGVDGYNLIASIGAFFLVAGILVQLGNAAYSWNNGIPAGGHDPWGGATLEWFTTSPPPVHNFDVIPDVRSPEPLHDIRDAIRRRAASFTRPEPLERLEPVATAGEDRPAEESETPPPQQDAPAPPAPSGGAPEPDQGEPPYEAGEAEAQPEAPGEQTPQTPEADSETGGGEDDQGSPSVA